MKNRQILSNAIFAVFCMAGAVSAWALTSGGAKDRKPAPSAQKTVKPGEPVTYVGCLRADDGGKKYVLTEVGGPDAPKARSWKTGFLTKKAGKLDVVAPGLHLRDHVDHTVQLSGRRSGKVLRANALTVIGSTCG